MEGFGEDDSVSKDKMLAMKQAGTQWKERPLGF